MESNNKADLVAAVKSHARANYGRAGWDIVVECWDDQRIAERIGGCSTPEAAIAAVGKIVGILQDYEDDIRAEVF